MLDLLQLMGKRRLREVQPPRRRRERPLLGDGEEEREMAEREGGGGRRCGAHDMKISHDIHENNSLCKWDPGR